MTAADHARCNLRIAGLHERIDRLERELEMARRDLDASRRECEALRNDLTGYAAAVDRERAAMHLVVDAAKRLADFRDDDERLGGKLSDVEDAIVDAVETYRASKAGT